MKVYVNLTAFFEKEGISYRDRAILEILIKMVQRGLDLILFIVEEDEYRKVESGFVAEYFMKKNIRRKQQYISDKRINYEEILEEDVYFELENYFYSKIEKVKNIYLIFSDRGCRMFKYLLFSTDFNVKEHSDLLYEQVELLKYLDKVYCENEKIEKCVRKINGESEINTEILRLKNFRSINCNDSLLTIDKGMKKIILENKFMVLLLDYHKNKSNYLRLDKMLSLYPGRKIIIPIVLEDADEALKHYLYKNDKLGSELLVIYNVDYYTQLSLYNAAERVILPSLEGEYAYEVENMNALNIRYECL